MKKTILLINPNVTEGVTDVMAAEACRAADENTEIIPVTATFGAEYIENRVEAAIAGHAVLDVLASEERQFDGVIISAFGDPGLLAAREMLDVPVVGISEAAFHYATMLGKRFSMVCLTKRLGIWYRECAIDHGFRDNLISVNPLDIGPQDISRAREECGMALLELTRKVIDQDDPDILIMGGGPIAGLARSVEHEIPVPVLDGVSSAVHMATSLIALSPRRPTSGSFKRPASKSSAGLSAALEAWMAGKG